MNNEEYREVKIKPEGQDPLKLQDYIRRQVGVITEECIELTRLRGEKTDDYFQVSEESNPENPVKEKVKDKRCIEKELDEFFELVKDTLSKTNLFLTRL